jgi:hypothetical protein
MKQHEIPQAGRGAVEQYPDARTLQQLSLARSQLICAFPDAAQGPLLKASLRNPPEFHYSTLHREQKTEVGGDRSPTPPDCS